MDYHTLSRDHEVVENDLNEGLGCVRALVGDAAAAKNALPCGSNARDNNEYLQDALRLVDSLLGWEVRDDFEFVTAENPPSP